MMVKCYTAYDKLAGRRTIFIKAGKTYVSLVTGYKINSDVFEKGLKKGEK